MTVLQKAGIWLKIWLQWVIATSLSYAIGFGGLLAWSMVGTLITSLLQQLFDLGSLAEVLPAESNQVVRFLQTVSTNTGILALIGFAQYIVLRSRIKKAISWIIASTALGAISVAIAATFEQTDSFSWQTLIHIIVDGGLLAISISRQRRWIIYWITSVVIIYLVSILFAAVAQPYVNQLVALASTLSAAPDVTSIVLAFLVYLVAIDITTLLPTAIAACVSGIAVAQFLTEIEQTSPHLSKHPV